MSVLSTSSKCFLLMCVVLFSSKAFSTFDKQLLADIKKATVYIKVTSGVSSQSGTGFLIKRVGQKGIIVTNSHVASLNTQSQELSVVFNSGLSTSKSAKAKILSLNDAEDLAFLEISLDELPKPIRLSKNSSVSETDEVYIFGFPFGEALSTNQETPTVTVGKGTVSSKRLDNNEQLELIQIDGDINPGNSGGPITNAQGELLGVSVSAVRKTNIGFAIPSKKVLNNLAGKLGDLSASKDGHGISIIAKRIDPLSKVKGAKLIISRINKKSIPMFLGEDAQWEKLGVIKEEVSFEKSSNGRYMAKFSLPADEEKTYYGQIHVISKSSEIFQAPFMIINKPLLLELKGVDVVSGSSKVVLGKGSKSASKSSSDKGEKSSKDKLVHSLLVKSGIDSQIKQLVSDAESLLEEDEKEDDEEVNEYTKRLIEILNENWDVEAVRKTYLEVFKSNLELGHAHSMLSMFESDTLKNLHTNLRDIEDVEIDELRKFKKEFKNSAKNTPERTEVIYDIEKHRRLSELVVSGVRPTSLAIAKVINEARHRGGVQSEEMLKKQVENKLYGRKRGIQNLVYLIMKKKYEAYNSEELSQYLEIVQLPAFQWYITQEKEAYATIMENNVTAAEKKLYSVFLEMQKEALGLKKVVDIEGLSDKEVISTYIDDYGIGPMTDYVLSIRGGLMTISKGGIFDDHWGKPRKDFISPETILMDLEKEKISIEEFVKKYDKYLIDSQYVQSRVAPVRQSSSRRSSSYRSSSSGSANSNKASCRTTCALKRRDCMSPASDKRSKCLQSRNSNARSCSAAYDRAKKTCETSYERCSNFCPK